jgi:hypothetical protein
MGTASTVLNSISPHRMYNRLCNKLYCFSFFVTNRLPHKRNFALSVKGSSVHLFSDPYNAFQQVTILQLFSNVLITLG